MAKDFLSKQIRTNKIIGSSSSSPKLIMYPDDNALDNLGSITPTDMLTGLSSSTFLYVHGSKCGVEHNIPNSVSVFGGDVVIKGHLYTETAEESLWEIDLEDSDNLVPTNILDGDTGLFALDMNLIIDENTLQTSQYTMSNRSTAVDKYFEFDSDGNVMPRDVEAEHASCLAELAALNN
jgi:hypothetical protein